MVDINNEEIIKGDIVIFSPNKVIEHGGQLIIFKEMKTKICDPINPNSNIEETDTMVYYPLTKEGLEVANYDNTGTITSLQRIKEYTINYIKSDNLLKLDSNKLNSTNTYFYNQIIALL